MNKINKNIFYIGFALLAISFIYWLIANNSQLSANLKSKPNPSDRLKTRVLHRGNTAEVQSLDPAIANGIIESRLIKELFEGLVTQDADGKLIPGLAKSWKVSKNGKIYTFNLRDNLKWSDGVAITAEDVVYSWQRFLDPKNAAGYAFILYPIKNAKAINTGKITDLGKLGVIAKTSDIVEVELEAPTPYFTELLASFNAFPVPKHLVEKYNKDWTRVENIATSGAYKLTNWMPQARMVLEKSQTYYAKDEVKIEKVIFYPIENEASELKRFRAGDLDFTASVPLEQLKWLRKNMGEKLVETPTLSTIYLGFNSTKEPFKDNLKLRRALSLAVDKNILVEKVIKSGVAAYKIVPPGVNNYQDYKTTDETLTQKQRLAEAKLLYAEAGYSAENPLKIEILFSTTETNKKIAVAVAGMWQQNLGVKSTLTNNESKIYTQKRQEKQTQVFIARWLADYNDPNTFLDMWLPQSEFNDVGFNNKDFTNLIAQAGNELNLNKRQSILRQAEQIFTNDYAIIPLFYQTDKFLVSDKLKGWHPNAMRQYRSKHMYFVE